RRISASSSGVADRAGRPGTSTAGATGADEPPSGAVPLVVPSPTAGDEAGAEAFGGGPDAGLGGGGPGAAPPAARRRSSAVAGGRRKGGGGRAPFGRIERPSGPVPPGPDRAPAPRSSPRPDRCAARRPG